MAEYIGAPLEEISYWAAGINHMAWYLKYLWKGEDAYPLLWKAMEDPGIYARDIVKWEVMKHFGAFVSESSIHMSEYVPYFRRTPELIDRHTDEAMWGVQPKGTSREERMARWRTRREQREEENRRLAFGEDEIPIARSHEYFSRILNAAETNVPFILNGNVPNTGLIANLPGEIHGHPAPVEVPIVVDGCGLHPCYVGDLPPALAALNRSNLSVIELAVKGYLDRDRESIYRAIQLDPLTASLLSLAEIRQMVDILARRRKNNPIVVGEAGVGKTAIVEGLATKIITADVPEVSLDLLETEAPVVGTRRQKILVVEDDRDLALLLRRQLESEGYQVLLAGTGVDFTTAFGAVAACIGNIGPGFGMVGPVENFATIPVLGKWLLIWCMLLGRLEIFTILVLLSLEFWRR